MSNQGRIILITGGTRGIGKAIALRLAAEKPEHLVVAYCMNHDAARATVAELQDLGVGASSIPVDVSRSELVREMFLDVRNRFGRLDVFISNAARASFGPVASLSRRSWQRMMDLNAHSFLQGAQLAAELMQENGGGKIIGLSSLGSTFAIPGYAGLGAAKAAVEALTRYLAAEFAPLKINVNTVSAGFVDTESMKLNPEYESLVSYLRSRTPAGRIARPEDVSGVVAFLCSDDARWIHGQVLLADGGLSLVL